MDGEAWKISPPKSHPSNPVHKAAVKEQNKEVPISSNFPLTFRSSLSDHESRHRQWSLCEQFFWQVCWFGRVNLSAWRTVPSERRPQQELTAKCVPPERRCLALSCNFENWSSRSSRWGRAKETLGFFLPIFFRPFPKSLLSADRLIASMCWKIILFFQLKDVANRMDHTRFYGDRKFGLLIDLRSMVDKTMHGSGVRLVNTKDDVFIEIDR